MKQDYFEEIIKYDERVSSFCSKTHAQVLKEHLEVSEEQNEMNHMKYLWAESKRRFNKLMQEKI